MVERVGNDRSNDHKSEREGRRNGTFKSTCHGQQHTAEYECDREVVQCYDVIQDGYHGDYYHQCDITVWFQCTRGSRNQDDDGDDDDGDVDNGYRNEDMGGF